MNFAGSAGSSGVAGNPGGAGNPGNPGNPGAAASVINIKGKVLGSRQPYTAVAAANGFITISWSRQ